MKSVILAYRKCFSKMVRHQV